MATAAVALAALAALAPACSKASSGPGVAQAGSATASSTGKTGELAFSACMRSHGLANFPDPGGELPPGMDPNSLQYQAAQRACQLLLPAGQGGSTSTADAQRFLEHAACKRSHGEPNFPDPIFPPGGGAKIALPEGMNFDSPQFQAAFKACASWLPRGGKGRIEHPSP